MEEDEITIVDLDFADTILQQKDTENFEKTISDIFDFYLSCESDWSINESENVISNYIQFANELRRWDFFVKAGEVLSEILEGRWDNTDDWGRPQTYKFDRIKKEISDAIRENIFDDFMLDEDISKELLEELKPCIIPHYDKIKRVEIDGEIIDDIKDAQRHLNDKILLEAEFCLYDNIDIEVNIVLYDDKMEAVFDFSNAKGLWEFYLNDCFEYCYECKPWDTSIVEYMLIALDPHEELADSTIEDNEIYSIDECELSIEHYKENDDGVQLQAIMFKDDIYRDIDNFFINYDTTENITQDTLDLACKVLIKSYERDVEILQKARITLNMQNEIGKKNNFFPFVEKYPILDRLENNVTDIYNFDDYDIEKVFNDLIAYLLLKIEFERGLEDYKFEENRHTDMRVLDMIRATYQAYTDNNTDDTSHLNVMELAG